jgi:hypothetical protein
MSAQGVAIQSDVAVCVRPLLIRYRAVLLPHRGPVRAAKRFVDGIAEAGLLDHARRVRAGQFGPLGATGHGHGSPRAVVLGLEGDYTATIDTAAASPGQRWPFEAARFRGECPRIRRRTGRFDKPELLGPCARATTEQPWGQNGHIKMTWSRKPQVRTVGAPPGV